MNSRPFARCADSFGRRINCAAGWGEALGVAERLWQVQGVWSKWLTRRGNELTRIRQRDLPGKEWLGKKWWSERWVIVLS